MTEKEGVHGGTMGSPVSKEQLLRAVERKKS